MGQKVEWMRSNPLVCVEADEISGHKEWASVVVQGRYEEFPDTPEYAERRREVQSRLEKIRFLWWQIGIAATQVRGRFDRDITVFYCIHIEEITGRCVSPDPV
jgi:nitroimidazol reductase NimA-like FMN-containing flavoprotein (pyridoxamine 5'-phosphate oxidase superfamily)